MSELLCVPLKKTSDIDVSKPLRTLISSTYSSADSPFNANDAVQELQKMRQSAIRTAERGEAAISAIANYYDQLVSLEQKVPAHEVQIAFKWKNAFDRGSLFGGRISLVLSSLGYEKVCVLFNLGAINSVVASEHSKDTEDGLQKSLKKLQLASGIFSHLRDVVVSMIQTDPTPDLEPETLNALSQLMLAQAQEMIVKKALQDKMKDAIVAKLCAQCDELFASALRSLSKEAVRGNWDASWIPNVRGKQAIYAGLAQYHQSRVCNANKSIGEEIARLEVAKTLFHSGLERGAATGDLCQCKEWLKRTDRALTDAKKDNDFIYHERIPEAKNLAPVGKAVVAKPTLPLPHPLGTSGKDLFEALCPVAIHQALAAFDVRKQDIVNKEVTKLKDATNALNDLLSSMNLPAALEDTSGNALPGSLISKANMVKEAGGLESLNKLINELPELLTRNTEILDEAERMLKEEGLSDTQLRTQFKEKWTRTPSSQLTGTFVANAQKYRTIIDNAKQADGIVKGKLEIHKSGIEALGQGSSNLQAAIPSSGGQVVAGSATVTKLKALMENVETIKAEREVIESEFKNANIDMKPLFFEALNANGVIPEQEISTDSLNRVFGPLQTQVSDSMSRQENLVTEIKENHAKFVAESGGTSGSAAAREKKLKELAAAHDAFFELKGNLQEGTKFYNDLTQLLVTFQNKVSDFCFARRTEKEELMKDLTSGMASMKMESTPAPPAHHAPPAGGHPDRPPRKNDAPPRPPQPAENPYAGAPVASQAGSNPSNPPFPSAPSTSSTQQENRNAPYNPSNPYPYPPMGAPGMPPYQPFPTPMPGGYNPYGGYPPAPFPQQYPPQQPYAGYPPMGYPQYHPPASGFPPYPPQGGNPPQQ